MTKTNAIARKEQMTRASTNLRGAAARLEQAVVYKSEIEFALSLIEEARKELEQQLISDKYLNTWTGSIDTREGWVLSIEPMELTESGFDTAEELFDHYVEIGVIVRV